jgi:hypothetical protein
VEGLSRDSGAGSHGQVGHGIGFGLEQVADPGTELAVDGGVAGLKRETSAARHCDRTDMVAIESRSSFEAIQSPLWHGTPELGERFCGAKQYL